MKHHKLSLGQIEALVNKLGGMKAVEQALQHDRRIVIEKVSEPGNPALEENGFFVTTTITLRVYLACSLFEAIQLAGNPSHDESVFDLFGADLLGLERPIKIDLVKFARPTYYEEVIGWSLYHGRKPIETRHLLGVGIEHSTKQGGELIISLGSIRQGFFLALGGKGDRRELATLRATGQWFPEYAQFGFLHEEHRS